METACKIPVFVLSCPRKRAMCFFWLGITKNRTCERLSLERGAIVRFLYEIMRSRRSVRDCNSLGEVGPFGVIGGIGSLL